MTGVRFVFVCMIVLYLCPLLLFGQQEGDAPDDKLLPENKNKYKINRTLSDFNKRASNFAINSPAYLVINDNLSEQKLLKVLLENTQKNVVSFSEKSGTWVRYYLRDLEWEEKCEEWNKKGWHEHVVEPPIGPYKADGGVGQLIKNSDYDKKIAQRLASPDGYLFYVYIYFYSSETAKNPSVLHELVKYMIEYAPVYRKYDGSVVVECRSMNPLEPYYGIAWCSGNLLISIATDKQPEEVIEAYLKRYPSDLPKDMKFDRMAWGNSELSLRLKRMKERIETPDGRLVNNPPEQLINTLIRLRRTFIVPWSSKKYSEKKAEIYRKYVIGDGDAKGNCSDWKCDYEGYKKGLVEFNKRVVTELTEWAKDADKNLTWNKKERKFEIVEKKVTAPDAAASVQNWLVRAFAVAILVAIGVFIARLLRRPKATQT